MRPVMIVLPQVSPDVITGLIRIPILGQSNFLFLQAAMKTLDVAVAFRVMVSGAPMGDPQSR